MTSTGSRALGLLLVSSPSALESSRTRCIGGVLLYLQIIAQVPTFALASLIHFSSIAESLMQVYRHGFYMMLKIFDTPGYHEDSYKTSATTSIDFTPSDSYYLIWICQNLDEPTY